MFVANTQLLIDPVVDYRRTATQLLTDPVAAMQLLTDPVTATQLLTDPVVDI